MTRAEQDWDMHFLRVARECAMMSKDPSSQIGAVIVKDRRIVSTGFNGFPPGIADDHRLEDREEKYKMVVHAEVNAVIEAGRANARGGELYLWGYEGPPCTNCAKSLLAAGITHVVGSGTKTPDRWADSLREAEALLAEAGVHVTRYEAAVVLGWFDMTQQEREA